MKSVLSPAFANYPTIDWHLLSSALNYYETLGYKQIETPWAVPEQICASTKPHDDQSFVLDNAKFEGQPHELVGSAEQGFRYLITTGAIAPGKYCSISPCFRVDDYDALHVPWFMKLELCHIIEEGHDLQLALNNMIQQCERYFNEVGVTCHVVEIDDAFDIGVNGIEVGSYGIRIVDGTQYIYGTGLALPRFSIANDK